MKIVKKAAAMSLSAAMLMQFAALTPVPSVYAADTTKEAVVDGLTYVYVPDSPNKNECTVQLIYDDANKQVTKHDTVSIPEKIGNYTVTTLGSDDKSIMQSKNADSVHVTTIKLPHSIKNIHKNAMLDVNLPLLQTLYVDLNNLEFVSEGVFGYLSAVSEIYVYDKADKAFYPTSEDLDKYRELVSIEGLKFEEVKDKLDWFMISKEEYEKNPNVNGKLEFINAVSTSTYTRKVGYMYAQEAVKKYGIDSDKLSVLQKSDKISNYISGHVRYSFLFPYAETIKDEQKCERLASTALSIIGFHTGVCGGYAHSFEMMARAAMGNDIVDKAADVQCVSVPGHALNAVRPKHSDDNSGYYLVDNTGSVFMQGQGKAVGEYDEIMDGYVYGLYATDQDTIDSNHDIKIAKAKNMFSEGVSQVYLRDETKTPINIELYDKNNSKDKYINFTSYPVTGSTFYLEELPHTKCGEINPLGAGLNLYVEPNIYHDYRISNSKGEAVFGGDGEHKFKLGNVEYVCTITTRDYNSESPYGKMAPHTANKNYFEVVIKQLTDDTKPDTYTTSTTIHKTTTTTTTKTTTTTTKATTTTTKKPTTTTTAKPTTTTTKKPTTTTTKPATTTKTTETTTTGKAIPNIIPPKGKVLEYTGKPQELIVPGQTSGGTIVYKEGVLGSYSDEVPTGTEVGTYDIYYMVVGDENYYGANDDYAILNPRQGRKNYAFPYCYNCSREPWYPTKDNSCLLKSICNPLVSYKVFGTTPSGKWTLEYAADYKDFDLSLSSHSDVLKYTVEELKKSYGLSSVDDISVYELKDDGKHIAYGCIFSTSYDDSEALFIGDTWYKEGGGAGYVLTNETITGTTKTIKVTKDINELDDEKVTLFGNITAEIVDNGSGDILYGDANLDGNVDLSDAVLIMQSLSNPSKFGATGNDKTHITEQGKINGDVNNNGDGITNKDALSIQKYMLQLIPKLPES